MNLLKRHLNDLCDTNQELYKSSGNNYYEGVADGYGMALQLVEEYEKRQECSCATCKPNVWGNMRMILCKKCGNKRCPHATDHRNECTNSNEVGQIGSRYQGIKND